MRSAGSPNPSRRCRKAASAVPNLDVVRAKIVAAAMSQLGVPYVYGGTTPGAGFDCSGLAQWCCARAGIAVPARFGGSVHS